MLGVRDSMLRRRETTCMVSEGWYAEKVRDGMLGDTLGSCWGSGPLVPCSSPRMRSLRGKRGTFVPRLDHLR